LFIRRGGELSRLRELMGHASTDTTRVYIRHTSADLDAAVTGHETGSSVRDRRARNGAT
jgi:site-specific recombinase XerD